MKNETHQRNSSPTAVQGAGELEAHIQGRLGGRIPDLELVVEEQGVILRGHASTYYLKQLAQHLVMKTTGLPILANEIEVI